ncbi:hypothetical protein [Nonomuraea roseola]|uniref:Uncharacterized protein n=1 Tax=Nonomuraea roseola TaxID=46179 RepID=A0ABV5Q8A7_9ACTN
MHPTAFSCCTRICAADRAAFAEELATAVTTLVSKYHDDTAKGVNPPTRESWAYRWASTSSAREPG